MDCGSVIQQYSSAAIIIRTSTATTNTKITKINITLNNLTTIPLAETIAIITACIWLSNNTKLKNKIFLESSSENSKNNNITTFITNENILKENITRNTNELQISKKGIIFTDCSYAQTTLYKTNPKTTQ